MRFPLDLPAFVWKPLVNDELSRADLEAVDQAAVHYLKAIEECPEADFEATIVQNFAVQVRRAVPRLLIRCLLRS